MSIKRVIELDEIEINGQKFYKALGCNTLIFDENGFEKITKPIMAERKPCKPLNCKFVVTETANPHYFTVGNVYEVVDGKFSANNGKWPYTFTLFNEDDLVEYLSGRKHGFSHFAALPTKILVLNE